MEYSFFYDETEHSRKINIQTVTADNYYDNFSTAIIGWKKENEDKIIKQYEAFEEKYTYRKKNGELKSQTMKQKDLKYGFATLNNHTIGFYEDLLSMFNQNTVTYISVFSKVEYVIQQVFRDYHNSFFVDIDCMKYSIIKAILVYHPRKVIEAMYQKPKDFVDELRAFFVERICLNEENMILKEHENIAFKQILLLLDSVEPIISIDWEYYASFNGFAKLLQEMNIKNYDLVIDEEGDLHSTVKAAKEEGLINLKEANSQEYVGIRMADMFIGLISKVMQSLKKALTNDYANERIEKTLLEPRWFILDDRQLGLYKKLYQIICVDNKYWYSTYSGIYSDDLVAFIALLQFMSQFENAEALRNENYDILPEHFNTFACQALQERYAVMGNKLPIEFVQNAGDDFFLNQRGAKVFYDESRQPLLPITKGKNVYKVLSIGFGNTGTPMVTIENGRETVCYKLPFEYSEWAMTVVGCVNMGEKLVPGEVVFSLENGKYYADIL